MPCWMPCHPRIAIFYIYMVISINTSIIVYRIIHTFYQRISNVTYKKNQLHPEIFPIQKNYIDDFYCNINDVNSYTVIATQSANAIYKNLPKLSKKMEIPEFYWECISGIHHSVENKRFSK